ncbi:MAG: hypothetical protein K2O01_04445 [Bacteroidales bacterium]|nr:hypothetical protein [Bacteroidales bacterium]
MESECRTAAEKAKMGTNYETFIAQLDAFINRYYGYEIRKGILRSLAVLLLLFLLMAAAESLFFFGVGGGMEPEADWQPDTGQTVLSGSPSGLRTFLFWLYMLAAAGVVGWQVGLPLWKRLGGGACGTPGGVAAWRCRLSRMEAARLLSDCFPELGDKLYNVLELKEINADTSVLALAAIEQISADFRTYRFTSVFRPVQLRPLWYLLGVPLSLTVAAVFLFPSVLVGSSERLIHPRQVFVREFPFSIKLEDSILCIPYGERYTLRIAAEGDWTPSALTIWVSGGSVPAVQAGDPPDTRSMFRADCRTVSAGRYDYTFEPLYGDVEFRLQSGRYMGPVYRLRVVPPVVLTSLTLDLVYPAYTGLAPRRVDDAAELAETGVPYGTRLCWGIGLTEVQGLAVLVEEEETGLTAVHTARREPEARAMVKGREVASNGVEDAFSVTDSVSERIFRYETQAWQSSVYKFVPETSGYHRADTIVCRTDVWLDRYPRIEVAEAEPPAEAAGLYERILQGEISDDYGFHSLVFRVKDEDNRLLWTDTLFGGDSERMPDPASGSLSGQPFACRSGRARLFFSENGRWTRFVYGVTPEVWNLREGVSVFYELEVRDNDPYGGYKAAVSRAFSYRVAEAAEAQRQWREHRGQVAQALDSVSEGQAAFAEQYRDLSRSLLENADWDWSDRRKVERMIAEQKVQVDAYREAVQALKEQQRADRTEYSAALREQARQLEELMSQLWNEEALQKLEQITEWLQENAPKEKVVEALEQWQEEHRDLVQNWTRNQEIYKRLEFAKGLEKMTADLQELAQMQQDLQQRTEPVPADSSVALAEAQQALNRRYDEIQRTLEMLDRQNDALRRPFSFDLPSDLMEEVAERMRRAGEALERGETKSAAGDQQKASEGLQALSRNISAQQAAMQMNQDAEDAEYLRLLLKEIVRLSFEQEDVMGSLQSMTVSDPRYAMVVRRQNRLNRDVAQVADSIRALSVRQPQIAVHTQGVLKHLRSDSRQVLSDLLMMNTTVYRYYRTQNRQAIASQQRTMNGLNELALLLSESLDRMQMGLSMKGNGGEGMPQQGSGASESGKGSQSDGTESEQDGRRKGDGRDGQDGEKPVPGDGPSLSEMQESLNRGLEALQKAMQGQQGQVGSEAFMRAAAQQEMIRRTLQKQVEAMKRQDGKAQGDLQRLLGDMERTERELVHKTITPQMLLRQQQIQTRLLEAENAEMKREKEEQRESEEGREFEPFRIQDWKFEEEELQRSREGLQQRMPPLHPFFKQKVEQYFLSR